MRQAGSMPRRRQASTERGDVGVQAAGVAPGSVAWSAMSCSVTLGRRPAAATSRSRSRSASQLRRAERGEKGDGSMWRRQASPLLTMPFSQPAPPAPVHRAAAAVMGG